MRLEVISLLNASPDSDSNSFLAVSSCVTEMIVLRFYAKDSLVWSTNAFIRLREDLPFWWRAEQAQHMKQEGQILIKECHLVSWFLRT